MHLKYLTSRQTNTILSCLTSGVGVGDKMESEKHEVELKTRNCMNLSTKILEVGGLWYTGKTENISYDLYQKFVLVYINLWILCNYTQLYHSRNNFQELLEMMCITISYSLFLLRIYVYIFKKEQVGYVVKKISQNFIIHENKLTLENLNIIRNTLQQARKLIFMYAIFFLIGNMIYTVLTPMILSATAMNNSTETSRVLPAKLWLPIDQQVSPNYEILYGVFTVTSLFVGWLFFSIDILFFVVMIYITGQFTLLTDSLCNVSRNVYTRLSHDCQRGHQLKTLGKVSGICLINTYFST